MTTTSLTIDGTNFAMIKHDHDKELLQEVGCEVFDFTVDYEPDDWSQKDMEKVVAFCDELKDIGIETAKQFIDRNNGCHKKERGMSPEAVFTQEYINDNNFSEETWIVIDYQLTWDCNLRHDYDTAKCSNGYTYFFFK